MASVASSKIMDEPIDEDISDEEILKAIRNSMKDLQLQPPASPARSGLESVADVVHKDLSNLSEDEQFKLALEASKIEALPAEEQIKRAIEESQKDPDLDLALKLSMDPDQQENQQYREHFSYLRGAEAIPNLEDLERPKAKTSMSQRIAAKFPPKDFVNEELEKSQLEQAIKESLAELNPRPSQSLPTFQYSNVVETGHEKMKVVAAKPKVYQRSRKGQNRPIVIDGCNVAWQYGRNDVFDAKGLQITYNHFKDLGYADSDIIIILKHIPNHYLTEKDHQIIDFFKGINVIHMSPSRRAGNEIVKSDDDLFILNTAKTLEGVVLSADRYKHEHDHYPEYRDIIRSRLIVPTFIHNKLILPVDPLGKKGPKLEEILKFDK